MFAINNIIVILNKRYPVIIREKILNDIYLKTRNKHIECNYLLHDIINYYKRSY